MSDPISPTRRAALERLSRFVPHAGRDYAARRNFDLGPGQHVHVSGLSPWLRHRTITEQEVLHAVLARHTPAATEKFVQEVFWRTYWKGWLERRPATWAEYRAGVTRALNRIDTEDGLRTCWAAACRGETGIDAMDAWARELVDTGYLHNHARMWFASIWIFTLRLPWELGADFFLRHLLDGDPAANTLGWRWVAGLHTPGKHYVARPDNIAKYTEGRFHPQGLAPAPAPLDGPAPPPPGPVPAAAALPDGRVGLLLTEDDLSPGWLIEEGLQPAACAALLSHGGRSPLAVSTQVARFTRGLAGDALDRLGATGPLSENPQDIVDWAAAEGLNAVATPYAPVGPAAEALDRLADALNGHGIALTRHPRPYDLRAWPHATHGFFRFKSRIPDLLSAMGLGDSPATEARLPGL
ncbi:FAD-binding domain-containing protein [Rhodovulum adriaticum]|uniref:Deoxyribodipyrimidine photo-lyase n=1 Tax=Rhodovulum adriaticum TaxID=35804 RepID=A0A4R2NJD4_RHOAD|nr:FAD-binding domain-containing protein [Rhodovulum adriaticum]MBK1634605.1 DNA photolyase [Rhodovulum adriaticum]TCP21234.1 deoxyribodipyrimidine photo-lyase [Rhodovulum adriaticum]